MTRAKLLFVASVLCLATAGCNTLQTPIVAGAVDTVGISASTGPQDQGGGSFTFGYKGAKFAVVPVEGQTGPLALKKADGSERGFSVFAMLGVDARGGAGPGVGLEQVVAVGPAAEIWAWRAPVLVVNNGGQIQSVPIAAAPASVKPGN